MPSVQAELARWTLVYLDADKLEEEANELNVTAVPTFRVRTALGQPIASRDGLVSAEDLVAWLRKQYESAAAEADDVLLTNDEPDAAGVVRLVRQFHDRDPAIREAAIRRLAAWPRALSANRVVTPKSQDGSDSPRRMRWARRARTRNAAWKTSSAAWESVRIRRATP